jgi:hypothetical protein
MSGLLSLPEFMTNRQALVGWVERSDTHQAIEKIDGIAALHPSCLSGVRAGLGKICISGFLRNLIAPGPEYCDAAHAAAMK